MAIDMRPDLLGKEFEVYRVNVFELFIKGGDIGVDNDQVKLALRRVSFPELAVDSFDVHFYNSIIKLAAKQSSLKDFTAEFDDILDNKVAASLLRWSRRAYDPETGKVGLAKNYKINATLRIGSPDGETTQDWKLLGVWVKSVSFPDGDMTSSGPVRITATFAADFAIPELK